MIVVCVAMRKAHEHRNHSKYIRFSSMALPREPPTRAHIFTFDWHSLLLCHCERTKWADKYLLDKKRNFIKQRNGRLYCRRSTIDTHKASGAE